MLPLQTQYDTLAANLTKTSSNITSSNITLPGLPSEDNSAVVGWSVAGAVFCLLCCCKIVADDAKEKKAKQKKVVSGTFVGTGVTMTTAAPSANEPEVAAPASTDEVQRTDI